MTFKIDRADEPVVDCKIVRKRDSQGRLLIFADGAERNVPVARQAGPGAVFPGKSRGGSPEKYPE